MAQNKYNNKDATEINVLCFSGRYKSNIQVQKYNKNWIIYSTLK